MAGIRITCDSTEIRCPNCHEDIHFLDRSGQAVGLQDYFRKRRQKSRLHKMPLDKGGFCRDWNGWMDEHGVFYGVKRPNMDCPSCGRVIVFGQEDHDDTEVKLAIGRIRTDLKYLMQKESEIVGKNAGADRRMVQQAHPVGAGLDGHARAEGEEGQAIP